MADSRYLIRFDDICPTMNWTVWEALEPHLVRCGVKPILAVVPDNRDPNLVVGPPRPDFWERVRAWQARGYTIALHGYQHLYVNRDPGLVGLTPHSEFAGLPRGVQELKLRKALAIFAEEGVRAEAWVAPSHSFDRTTLGLLADLGLRVVSDGLWPRPFTEAGGPGRGITWIPQQLWSFQPKANGIWTVCSHLNGWSLQRVEQFARALQAYAPRLTDVPTVLREYAGRRITLADRWRGWAELVWTHRIVERLREARRHLRTGWRRAA